MTIVWIWTFAVYKPEPGWPCTVSAALKNLSQDFKNYFYIGCRSRKITWITRKSLKLFHAITFTLRLQRSNYFSCFDYYFGGSHQCLQNLYLLIEKDTLKSFFFWVPQEFHTDCRDKFNRSINSFTLLFRQCFALASVRSTNIFIKFNFHE